MEQLRPFALRTERAVGRVDELNAIQKALADPTRRSHILYFVGPGGIGKTRILEDVERLAANQPGTSILHSEIIDLYHSELHSVGGLETAIVEGLDPHGRRFPDYREARYRFEQHRTAGVAPEVLRQEQRNLDAIFLSDYNRMAQESRVLLRLDTTELIQYESDPVQEVCQIAQEAVEVRNWLLDTLPRLENTIVLLAGRPLVPLRAELQARCTSQNDSVFRAFDLKGLTLEESLAYFDALAALDPRLKTIPDDMRHRIWAYTGGHPIRLSLVIDLTLNGRDVADLFPLPGQVSQPAVGREEIDGRLVDELMRLSWPIQGMLRYLALARKGLDADLLYYLASDEWSLETCRKHLEQMRCFTFVKARPGTDLLFMHDELYELLDRFVLRERQHYQHTYETIARYYEEKLNNGQGLDVGERRTLRTTLLYYELQADPWEAFWRCYVRWDEEAVRAYDSDLDMRLRDELLRFLKAAHTDPWVSWRLPRDVVDRDAAVRWVRRYLSRAEHGRAAEIGRRLLESDLPLFSAPDPLYRAALQTAHAEALIYTGVAEKAVFTLLDQAVSALESWKSDAMDDSRVWWQQRILGRAYNDRGYLHWQAGRNGAAIREFRKALWCFRQADVLDELADTLTNLGFVYGRWGYKNEAETILLDAIDIRKRLGQESALALSLNALGLTYVYDGAHGRGQQFCTRALEVFQQLEQLRGIGLAYIAIGLALRKRGDQWKTERYSQEDAEEFFRQAVEHLERAERIFATQVPEPLRLWEAHSEWGSTYCDWGWLLLKQGHSKEAERTYDRAVEHLQKSVEIAKRHGFALQLRDSYDDLSQIYADRGAPEAEYMKWLEMALDEVPKNYRLTKRGFRKLSDPVEGWWLVWGKYHLGCGVRAMKQATERDVPSAEEKERLLGEAAEHYAQAVAYFQQYSPQARELEDTLQSIYRRLKTVRADRLARLRKQIADFARDHKVNLDRLLVLLDATLGLEPVSLDGV